MPNALATIMRRLIRRNTALVEQQKRLLELKRANPSCVIKSHSLERVVFGEYVTVLDGVGLDNVHIDNFSYVSYHSRVINATMGKFCSVGAHVQIGLAPHPSRNFVSTYPAFYSNRNSGCALNFRGDSIFDDSVPKTRVGSDVWIGSEAMIPGGITIGNGAIVAARSVVVKDVAPYTIVGGNPAKPIRLRFTEEQVAMLMASEWWEWPLEKIRQCVNDFGDIAQFFERQGK